MTNEQLAITLVMFRDRLNQAIEEAHQLMPRRAPRMTRRSYEGPTWGFGLPTFSGALDPENYRDVPLRDFVALQPLRDVVTDLERFIGLLEPRETNIEIVKEVP
jgi:hypothetical protein